MIDNKEKLEFLANKVKHLTFNKHIVQLIVGDKWYYAYHGIPESGKPDILYGSREEAFDAVLEKAISDNALDVNKA